MFLLDDAFVGPKSLKHLSLTLTSMDDLKFLTSLETLDLGDNDRLLT